jgi:PadR family transcriptional regulator PadR
MAPRRRRTEAAVAETAARSDVRAAAGARPAGDGRTGTGGGAGGGPGSTDPLVAGLRKAGLLRLLVLHLLGEGPSYGNQLMERVGELTGGLVAVNPNTMYPLLRTLEGEGLVAGEWEHPERRSRRFYRLTPQGAAERELLVSELGPRLDELAVALEVLRRKLLG